MSANDSNLNKQAQEVLDAIAFMPFDQCHPLNRKFEDIPARPGIHAVRHRSRGLLYIGKTQNLRGRFRGGHKAFLWAWLDKYDPSEVRIAFQTLTHWKTPTLLLDLLHNSATDMVED